MTNEGAGNSVIAIDVGNDGLLTAVSNIVSTGGTGGSLINSTDMPAGPDAFGSQGSVQVVGDVSGPGSSKRPLWLRG